jgi:hypothetical protein
MSLWIGLQASGNALLDVVQAYSGIVKLPLAIRA